MKKTIKLSEYAKKYSVINKEGRKIEVVNMVEDEKSDLMQDLVLIIY